MYVYNNSVGGGRYVLKKEWSCLNVCTFYLYILISAMPLLCRNRCQCRPSFIPTNSDHLIKHTTHSLNRSIISHCNTVMKRRHKTQTIKTPRSVYKANFKKIRQLLTTPLSNAKQKQRVVAMTLKKTHVAAYIIQ